jgi:hypothetical protein
MQRIPEVARSVRHGLGQALTGSAPAQPWRWRSPGERRAAYAGLAVATVALCFINATTAHAATSAPDSQPAATAWQLLIAVVTIAPLPRAARYPMAAWRIGWLGLLLTPLLAAGWWGGWPWGPPQGARAARGVLPGRGPPAAAGIVVHVGAHAHPMVRVVHRAHPGSERPGQRHPDLPRGGDRGGQRRLPAADPARAGGADRAHRGRAGPPGRTGGAHQDRAGAARRGSPPHVADRGPGRDRAVPARRAAVAGSGGVRRAERGDAPCARRHRAVVGDEDERQPAFAPELVEEADDLVSRPLVEVPRRLIGEQDLRLLHQRAGDGHALVLPAGKLGRQVAQSVTQPD